MNGPVVVAGGSGALGTRVAERMRRRGADVLVLDRVAPPSGTRFDYRSTDLTDDADVAAAAAELAGSRGAPTALVNCQGWSPKNAEGLPVADAGLTSAEFLAVLHVNLVSCYATIRSFVPLMVAAGGGRIVTVGSTSGRTGRTTASPAYAAAKAGVEALTRSVAVRYGPAGVLACTVAPGKFANPNWPDDPAALAAYRAEIPLGRLATADEVAGVVAFLASEDNRYLTGQTVVVDGGRLA